MMYIPNQPLNVASAGQLTIWQTAIDSHFSYEDRVKNAKSSFKLKNVVGNNTFRHVRETLEKMCFGHRRCMYCEDSCADEVEHAMPKDLYPEQVFCWENYLYACGPCNGPKSNRYAIFSIAGVVTEVGRNAKAPIVPPIAGEHVFINPRLEDPFLTLELDLSGTFRFRPMTGANAVSEARANWTIVVLGLNTRKFLVKARENVFNLCRVALREYSRMKMEGADLAELDNIQTTIMEMPHPTVFNEMQRQAAFNRRIGDIFRTVPEALSWSR